jgi:hypothetical protein
MDDQERQYLVNTIKELERSKRRWKATALAAVAGAAFIFVMTGGINLLQGFRTRALMQEAAAERDRAEAESQRALEARQQAEAARQQERSR